MQDSRLYTSVIDILGPTGAYIGSIGSSGDAISITGFNAVGPTGPTGFISTVGGSTGDYVRWDGTQWTNGQKSPYFAISLGTNTNQVPLGSNTISLGYNAGRYNQNSNSIAIGNGAGSSGQFNNSVAIGIFAGNNLQGINLSGNTGNSIAIGNNAGQTSQGAYGIAIGNSTGRLNQGIYTTAIGTNAGQTSQGAYATAIGHEAGNTGQGAYATAIGYHAGRSNQGAYGVAIGANAGKINQPEESIVINASSTFTLNGVTGGCIINPIRGDTGPIGYLTYNNTSKEVVYNTEPLTLSRGKTLVVDSVNGNDTIGNINKYKYPFKTVSAAISASVSGDTVFIYPGQYEESITVKSGTAVRGINVQTVSIQKTNVLTDTVLATMSSNSRLEDVTLNLTGATGGITLTGVNFSGDSAQTAKLRTAVVNVSNYDPQPSTAYGILSNGTTSNTLIANSSNAVRASTVNVNLGSTGSTGYGIFVNANNRFTCRDTNVFAKGPTGYDGNTGTHIIGGVVEAPSGSTGFLDLKCSTFSGSTYDINRLNGQIQLGFTDLVNNKANGNSFSVVTESSTTIFGLIGNLSAGTYYLVPGTIKVTDLPATAFEIPITQNMILFSGVLKYTGTIGVGVSITMNVYKNAGVTPVYSITLTQGESIKINQLTSVDFTLADTYHADLVVVGNPGAGTFTSTLGFY